jgi:hypothetical protein
LKSPCVFELITMAPSRRRITCGGGAGVDPRRRRRWLQVQLSRRRRTSTTMAVVAAPAAGHLSPATPQITHYVHSFIYPNPLCSC